MAEPAKKGGKPTKSKSGLKIDFKDPGVRNVGIAILVIGLIGYFWTDSYLCPKID